MKIYTKTGDGGKTSIIGGRVDKHDLRIEAIGTVDELNCFIGQAIAIMHDHPYADMKRDLSVIQHKLFDCGADLALLHKGDKPYHLHADSVDHLEQWIDRYDTESPELRRFILPGGTQVSAFLHSSRAICRRAERCVVALGQDVTINETIRIFLNRLSDLLFVCARAANVREGHADIEYVSEG